MTTAMNDTTRKYPRTLRETWPLDCPENAMGIADPVIPPKPPLWVRVWAWLTEAACVYRLYRRTNTIAHSLRAVRNIVVRGGSF